MNNNYLLLAQILSELLKAAIQANLLAKQMDGMSEEEAKAEFRATMERFLVESAKPINPVQR